MLFFAARKEGRVHLQAAHADNVLGRESLHMEQSCQPNAGLAAVAWVKGLFPSKEGIPPQDIVDHVAPDFASPLDLADVANGLRAHQQLRRGDSQGAGHDQGIFRRKRVYPRELFQR
jgi:hypothetical protein